MATRSRPGFTALRNSSCVPACCGSKVVTPVRFISAGMLQIRGQSIADRLDHNCKNNGDAGSSLADGSNGNRSDDSDEIDTEANQLGGEFGKQMQLSFGCSQFKADAFPIKPSEVSKF